MEKKTEASDRKSRKGEIQKIILETVKVAGLLSIGLVAPNVLKAMSDAGLISIDRQSEIIKSSASKLVRKGLLRFNGKYYELTSAGEKRLRKWELNGYVLGKPKKWDKKWRIIIFDIPERKKRIRDQVRQILVSAGLARLQDSVWVYPYDCEDLIGLLKTEMGIGSDLLFIVADEIENDKYLRMDFDLI